MNQPHSASAQGTTRYRISRTAQGAVTPVALDAEQRRVVDHAGGPLLVLAGPGTGKTTTLVEAIAARVENRGVRPEQILALTFSRKAAEQLRDRVTARVGGTVSAALCTTFHSFAYSLIRSYSPADLYDSALRLLSAPEADVVLRELLHENPESIAWPESLRAALGTRGFTREVQTVLSRAREQGLDGVELRRLGAEAQIPEFVAAGYFLDQYLTILDSLGSTDYADLMRRAVIEAEAHRDELRHRYACVFVDEYQDTDPGQVALLQALAGDGRDLVAVGDPHQSIYGFRGAEVRGILDFPRQFPTAAAERAPVVVLRRTRRFGPKMLLAAGRIARRLPLGGSIGSVEQEEFLSPVAVPGPGAADGRVEVYTYDTERAEAEHLADLLRRAHLVDGIDWSKMAVLVRSGKASIPVFRRSLVAAGVPVEVASDELPLVRDPAVLPLLDGLRAVVNLDNDNPESAGYLDSVSIEALLMSPLGGLDASDIRALQRALRARDKRQSDNQAGGVAASSGELLRSALVVPGFLDGLEGSQVERARATSTLLHQQAARLSDGAGAEDILWGLWSATGWSQRLLRRIDQGGGAARRAHRDLDSICALFEVAARVEVKRGHTGVGEFLLGLMAQQIPADTLAERGLRGSAVRLLTAHRSKGLEWDLVVVAHVQAEQWPDLRRRSSILGADRIGRGQIVPPVTTRELLQEERRLFYVACTRARKRLVVTAVRSADDEGEQPSRFIDDLGVRISHRVGRPARPLSLGGLVAELRRTVTDPDQSPALQEAAARRLAVLATEQVGGRALVPAADPRNWWGCRSSSRSQIPLRDPDEALPLSASALEGLSVCAARWFWSREAGGVSATHQAANLGQILHALAERVAKGDLAPDVATLMAEVDSVWSRLEFRTPWARTREYERTANALRRFVQWHQENPRRLVETEVQFDTEVDIDRTRIRLVGFADRIEVTETDQVVIVDLKTGRNAPSGKEVERNLQLALYQYAAESGALARVLRDHDITPDAGVGGAELVQLGELAQGTPAKVQAQPVHTGESPERIVLQQQIRKAEAHLRTESFPATAGQHCRLCEFTAICPAKTTGSVTVQ